MVLVYFHADLVQPTAGNSRQEEVVRELRRKPGDIIIEHFTPVRRPNSDHDRVTVSST